MSKIVHITPALPPAINGVGDFSALLAKNFEHNGYDNNLFFVMKSLPDYSKYDKVFQFSKNDFYAKLQTANPKTIVLHYVGYSYHEKGLPFYLVNALKRYKQKTNCTLLVFFHELYSSSNSLFRLSFYTNPLQKKIVKELYGIATQTFTNCIWYQNLLKRLLRRQPVKNSCTGIYSNVPDELYDKTSIRQNSVAVVFGSHQRRQTVYNNPQLNQLLNRAGINLIYDIGPGKTNFQYPQVRLVEKGCLPPADAAVFLNEARFGLLDYPPGLLGKSGIFSAYCAFGLVPVNTYSRKESLQDGLHEGVNYFHLHTAIKESAFENISQNVREWYAHRSEKAVTKNILQHI